MDTNSRLYASPCVSFESAWYTHRAFIHTHTHGPCPAKSNPQKLKDYPGLRAATASRNGRVTTPVPLDHPTWFNLDAGKTDLYPLFPAGRGC